MLKIFLSILNLILSFVLIVQAPRMIMMGWEIHSPFHSAFGAIALLIGLFLSYRYTKFLYGLIDDDEKKDKENDD